MGLYDSAASAPATGMFGGMNPQLMQLLMAMRGGGMGGGAMPTAAPGGMGGPTVPGAPNLASMQMPMAGGGGGAPGAQASTMDSILAQLKNMGQLGQSGTDIGSMLSKLFNGGGMAGGLTPGAGSAP